MSGTPAGTPMNVPNPHNRALESIAVIGCSRLARELATLASFNSLKVFLYCETEQLADEAMADIQQELDFKVSRWTISNAESKALIARIHAKTEFDPSHNVSLAFDCSGYSGDERAQFVSSLDEAFDPSVVIACNLSGTTLADAVKLAKRPERFVGVRFMPPVWKADVVETFTVEKTSGAAYDFLRTFIEKVGMNPHLLEDVAGNVSARVFSALFIETVKIIEQQNIEPAAADELIKDLFGMRFGPLEMADRIGLDNVRDWCERIAEAHGREDLRPPKLLEDLVDRMSLGLDCGRGFHSYDDSDKRG
ncbi:MAG: 3-hydroxyacyl-CoA dehydrogenase family protein [Planctomycetota bacterium]|nr:3-hydroxyacyl-CoA dehydrogenase family protein [Planctomycetota bacterium]